MLDFIFWSVVVSVLWLSYRAYMQDRKVNLIENYRSDKMEAIDGPEGEGTVGSHT